MLCVHEAIKGPAELVTIMKLYICMLCVHEAIKGPAELVTIMKLDGILSLSDVSAVYCFVITTIAIRMLRQGSIVYHRQIL
jgi:hypothetical protein